MKSTIILILTIAAGFMSKEKQVDVVNSKVIWKAYKVTGQHEGTIQLQGGNLNFDDKNQLTGGTFTMDMSTIAVTDLQDESKGKLENHLKSEDFFGVKKHTTSTFTITKVEGKNGKYTVTGDLVIKDISFPNTFTMVVNDNNTAMANLKIDRSKYEIKYGSTSFFDGLKDKAIYDEFDLNVNLKF